MTQINKFLTLTWVIFMVCTSDICGQEIDKKKLLGTWYLEKYRDDANYYPPTKKEKNDYILLERDMRYVAKTEGTIEKGTWMLNTNGAYIELKDPNGEREKMYIKYATPNTLVVLFDIEGIRELEVHYTSCNQ